MKPFRWNIQKKEQLGSLIAKRESNFDANYKLELIESSAKLIARSEGRRLIFIGRSPENYFDFLSGAQMWTTRKSDIELLNISNRYEDIREFKQTMPDAYIAIKSHFELLGISPHQLIASDKGIYFCDLVHSGATFGRLFEFLIDWTKQEKLSVASLISKIGFLGVTQRTKNSPNTWRWQQQQEWVEEFKKLKIKNVSISYWFWDYLGNRQEKVTRSNFPEKWSDESILNPFRGEKELNALTQAYHLFNLGIDSKKLLAKELAKQSEVKEQWLRSFILELKNHK